MSTISHIRLDVHIVTADKNGNDYVELLIQMLKSVALQHTLDCTAINVIIQ